MVEVWEIVTNFGGLQCSFPCAEDVTVLAAMQHAGLDVISVGCRGGGCGICKVKINAGVHVTKVMSRAHISETEAKHGAAALACCLYPRENMQVEPVKKSFKI